MSKLGALREIAERILRNMQRDPADKLMYRGVRPVDEADLSSAVVKNRPNSVAGSEWWSDNPMIASSYGPFVRSARMSRAPDALLDARSQVWDKYFFPEPMVLEPEFSQGLGDERIRELLVRDIQDTGPRVWRGYDNLEREFEDLSGLPATLGSNLLIKRGSDILIPTAPVLKARGGLAQIKECSCGHK